MQRLKKHDFENCKLIKITSYKPDSLTCEIPMLIFEGPLGMILKYPCINGEDKIFELGKRYNIKIEIEKSKEQY
jgi:hypothetical protein